MFLARQRLAIQLRPALWTPARQSSTLLQRLTNHYIASGDSAAAAESLASQELGWLEEYARAPGKDDWKDKMEKMVGEMIDRHKPIAFVLGTQPFHPIPKPLLVEPPTLIPRPETEHWVTHLASLLQLSSPATVSARTPTFSRPFRLLDIGTGTGCIPLALVHSLPPPVQAVAIDESRTAFLLARQNLSLNPCPEGSTLAVSRCDLFSDMDLKTVVWEEGGAKFDLVVSNPPYVTKEQYRTLPKSVKDWEDPMALVGTHHSHKGAEDDGLVFYRRITKCLPMLLRPPSPDAGKEASQRPCVALEVGQGQAEAVAELVRAQHLRAEVFDDQFGVGRCVLGYHL